jgi:hypothetical protein
MALQFSKRAFISIFYNLAIVIHGKRLRIFPSTVPFPTTVSIPSGHLVEFSTLNLTIDQAARTARLTTTRTATALASGQAAWALVLDSSLNTYAAFDLVVAAPDTGIAVLNTLDIVSGQSITLLDYSLTL